MERDVSVMKKDAEEDAENETAAIRKAMCLPSGKKKKAVSAEKKNTKKAKLILPERF